MSKERFWDIAAASPLIALYALATFGFALELRQDLAQMAHPLRAGAAIVSHIASALFVAMQIVLFLVRKPPVAKLSGAAPRVVAAAGSNTGLLYYFLQRAGSQWAIPSAILIALGMAASTVALLYLGRAFSILPQARQLVTSGPYRIVRHPLYLAEQVSSFGVMLQFVQPWSALVFLFGVALQWPRMIFEERILAETFPEYRDYVARTWRIIPGIY